MLCQLLLNMLCMPALVGQVTITTGGLMDHATIETGPISAQIIFRSDAVTDPPAAGPNAQCRRGVCVSAKETCAPRQGRAACEIEVRSDKAVSPALLTITAPTPRPRKRSRTRSAWPVPTARPLTCRWRPSCAATAEAKGRAT